MSVGERCSREVASLQNENQEGERGEEANGVRTLDPPPIPSRECEIFDPPVPSTSSLLVVRLGVELDPLPAD